MNNWYSNTIEITFKNKVTGEEVTLDRTDDLTNYYFNNNNYEVIF